ncbi:glycosyltransferase [Tsuneonella suprasediminis]|nr:glycosyltransferase [Tsuneonella suprasediminis]
MLKILCIADYYQPGFKAGGPITTIANMRETLNPEVSLCIFTRDRDLGDVSSYDNVEVGRWLQRPNGPIFYAPPAQFGPLGIKKIMSDGNFDAIYLNSFFSAKGSIGPYFAQKTTTGKIPIIIAPRGEFSPAALKIKRLRKLFYIKNSNLLRLYRDVFWHASSKMEADDILKVFPDARDRIRVALDPVSDRALSRQAAHVRKEKVAGEIRIVFISRISPIKNLDGLLDILQMSRSNIILDIFGPIEDMEYWHACKLKISSLPRNICTNYYGPLEHNNVASTFALYDLFAFPTHSENFGHVIFESICAGTPVIVSDKTPWQGGQEDGINVIPLRDRTGWASAIDAMAALDEDEHTRLRKAVESYGRNFAKSSDIRRENISMFRSIVDHEW